jgi:anti-anti-sigma factor
MMTELVEASATGRPSNRTVWVSARDEPPAEATITWALEEEEVTTLDLAGVLCTLTVQRVRDLIAEVAEVSPAPVAIDMSGVTFIDGRGLSLMLTTQERLAARGLGCEIVNPSPVVRRLFDVVGLQSLLSA